jgi:hypothetical protein
MGGDSPVLLLVDSGHPLFPVLPSSLSLIDSMRLKADKERLIVGEVRIFPVGSPVGRVGLYVYSVIPAISLGSTAILPSEVSENDQEDIPSHIPLRYIPINPPRISSHI